MHVLCSVIYMIGDSTIPRLLAGFATKMWGEV